MGKSKEQKSKINHLEFTRNELEGRIFKSTISISRARVLNEAVLAATKYKSQEFYHEEVIEALLLAVRESLKDASAAVSEVVDATHIDEIPIDEQVF